MSVEVVIHDGALGEAAPLEAGGHGASISFEGVVRPDENGRPIRALDYEAYRPMADRMLQELGTRALEKFGVLRVRVEHSTGRVDAGRCSFRLQIVGAHRAECLDATAWFIDAMKRDVPIWKTPVHAGAQEGAAS